MAQFEVTEQEANLIASALAAQPYHAVAALIAKLQKQAAEQVQTEKAQTEAK